MRFTGVFGLALAVVAGTVFAGVLIHPQGTQAAANGIVSIEKPGLNALLGKTS